MASFKLRMGQHVLSSKLGKQQFRIRLQPDDAALAQESASSFINLCLE